MVMDMRGTLNVSKFQKTPQQPRFYGKACVEGVMYNLKGWEKEARDGPWISLMFENPAAQDGNIRRRAQPQRPATEPVENEISEDDIPF